jgi:hypothetical protein
MSWEFHYLLRMAQAIHTYGFAVQHVTADPHTGQAPFAYTVGLHTVSDRGYELAVSGLDPQASLAFLNALATRLRDRNTDPADGQRISGVVASGLVELRLARHPENLRIIDALYGFTPTVWQALWPDQNSARSQDDSPDAAQPLL